MNPAWPWLPPSWNDLAPGEVVCCQIAIGELVPSSVEKLRGVLTAEERSRGDRFLKPIDRLRFTACRGALRMLLARLVGAQASTLTLAAGANGKPELPGSWLNFNVAHGGETGLIALARDHPVGVDVEPVQPTQDRARLAVYFHPGERQELEATPRALAEQAFFRLWARKEAVAKALGLGLSLDLAAYRVSAAPAEPRVLALDRADTPPRCWSLVDLDLGPGYAAALAAPVPGVIPRCFRLELWR